MPHAFQAVAVDYDGTLTDDERPRPDVLQAMSRLRSGGRRVVLVTGRIMAELREAFPEVDDWFDMIVAENGAVLVEGPEEHRRLAEPVPEELRGALASRGVAVRAGEVLLACDGDADQVALEELRRLGLDCQLVRNRAALMILPAGVTKGTGLLEALGDLGVSHHSTIAVGDAENDHSLLAVSEVGVAVANAVPGLREHADVVLSEPDGSGILDLLDGPILSGVQRVHPKRWQVRLGIEAGGAPVALPASQINILIVGGSSAGKSYAAGLVAEQLAVLGYSMLVVDFEGDHRHLAELRGVLPVGGTDHVPAPEQIERLLRHRFASVVVDLSTMAPGDQDRFVAHLAPGIELLRATTGLPHWIFLDEAHRPLGPGHDPTRGFLRSPAKGHCLITYRPGDLPDGVMSGIDAVIAFPGLDPTELHRLLERLGHHPPLDQLAEQVAGLVLGQALVAGPGDDRPARVVELAPRRTRHVRHWHKYAHSSLPAHLRFHFLRGDAEPTGLVAANLSEFHHFVRHCEDAVIDHHTARGDFSCWIREALSDLELGDDVAVAERDYADSCDPSTTREAITRLVEARYLE